MQSVIVLIVFYRLNFVIFALYLFLAKHINNLYAFISQRIGKVACFPGG